MKKNPELDFRSRSGRPPQLISPISVLHALEHVNQEKITAVVLTLKKHLILQGSNLLLICEHHGASARCVPTMLRYTWGFLKNYLKSDFFMMAPNSCQIFGILLEENLSPRPFKKSKSDHTAATLNQRTLT